MRSALPLAPFFFDCLHLDGDDLLDRAYEERVRPSRASYPTPCGSHAP